MVKILKDKGNMKKNKHFAFSLTETMILLTILAIAVAVSTPMISRKMVNSTESGTTLSGGSHGRYEIFSKEIVTFGSDSYEKTSNSQLIGGDNKIVVFRRLDDAQFQEITDSLPQLSDSGICKGVCKQTLYEQINNAKPTRDSNGKIISVEFNGKAHAVGGRIIVENADVIYTKGCLNASETPKTFTVQTKDSDTCHGAPVRLPNDTLRIIEGNLVHRYHALHPETNNVLWELKNDLTDRGGIVTSIPWERLYSGNKLSIDRPITPTEGEYIGTFDPGEKAKNIGLHAVGGGGAGGGLGEAGSAISPKNMDSIQIAQLKKDLADRFNKINGTSIPADKLVMVGTADIMHSNYFHDPRAAFLNDEDAYIYINTSTGTITGKVDVRNKNSTERGYIGIFPNELLDYTKVLGTQTQTAQLYDMPIWGRMKTMEAANWHTGVVGKGFDGGNGPQYKIDTTGVTIGCLGAHHCKIKVYQTATKNGWYNVCTGKSRAAKLDYSKIEKDFGITGLAASVRFNINEKLIAAANPMFNPSMHQDAAKAKPATTTTNTSSSSSKPSTPSKPKPPACISSDCFVPPLERGCACDACYNKYYTTPDHAWTVFHSGCSPANECSVHSACKKYAATSETCHNNIVSGNRGLGAPSAVACVRITEGKKIDLKKDCGYAKVGGDGYAIDGSVFALDKEVVLASGGNGSSCFMKANLLNLDNSIYKQIVGASFGGGGGRACAVESSVGYTARFEGQTEPNITSASNLLKTSNDKITPIEHIVNAALGKYKVSKGDVLWFTRVPVGQSNWGLTKDTNGRYWLKTDNQTVMNQIQNTADAYAAITVLNNTPSKEAMYDIRILDKDKATEDRVCAKGGGCNEDREPCSDAINGTNGESYSSCANMTGINIDKTGEYNHIYTWTMPYRYNQLTFGEAGAAGEYKTTKISKVSAPLTIKLGQGGVWGNSEAWKTTKQGKNGTATTVKMGDRVILTANGGLGGAQSHKTKKYDLCYPIASASYGKTYTSADNDPSGVGYLEGSEEGICRNGEDKTGCCYSEKGTRATIDVISSTVALSLFDNIKAMVGNSKIIGIGLGRGGEGAGSRAGVEEVSGVRKFMNASAHNVGTNDRTLIKQSRPATSYNEEDYKNKPMKPSDMNFKGGDGAVIITW